MLAKNYILIKIVIYTKKYLEEKTTRNAPLLVVNRPQGGGTQPKGIGSRDIATFHKMQKRRPQSSLKRLKYIGRRISIPGAFLMVKIGFIEGLYTMTKENTTYNYMVVAEASDNYLELNANI